MKKVSSKEDLRDMILNGEDISKVAYSHITDMSFMFYGCSSLTKIPYLDTSKVTDMEGMFYGCNNLEHIEDPYDFHLYDWSDEDAPKNDILLDNYPDLYI